MRSRDGVGLSWSPAAAVESQTHGASPRYRVLAEDAAAHIDSKDPARLALEDDAPSDEEYPETVVTAVIVKVSYEVHEHAEEEVGVEGRHRKHHCADL